MEKTYQYVKRAIVTFKLDFCCWLLPIRVGIFIIAYLNLLEIYISLISLLSDATESFTPTIVKIQQVIMADYVSKPIPILVYCAELGFNVLLLCAMYRRDIVLAQIFVYYNVTSIVACTLVYSMVIPAIDVLLTITIIASVLYQIYLLILVRSAIVEIKEERANENGVLFTSLKRENGVQEKVEIIQEPSTSDPEPIIEEPKSEANKRNEEHVSEQTKIKEEHMSEQTKRKEDREKLETVEEHPNEIRIELNPSNKN